MSNDRAKYTMDNPHPLPGRKQKQCGFDIYVGNCPRCGSHVAVSEPGRIPCNTCGIWLHIQHEDEARIKAEREKAQQA